MRKILALGLFNPIVEGTTIPRGMEGVVASAEESFPDDENEIITIRSLTNFEKDFSMLSDDFSSEHAEGKFRGVASGYFVQEALEGAYGITDIHYDLLGINQMDIPSHAGSELRSLVAHVRSFFPRKVHVHLKTAKGLTSFLKDDSVPTGEPLPAWLNGYFK